jgi:hypothetical protein
MPKRIADFRPIQSAETFLILRFRPTPERGRQAPAGSIRESENDRSKGRGV